MDRAALIEFVRARQVRHELQDRLFWSRSWLELDALRLEPLPAHPPAPPGLPPAGGWWPVGSALGVGWESEAGGASGVQVLRRVRSEDGIEWHATIAIAPVLCWPPRSAVSGGLKVAASAADPVAAFLAAEAEARAFMSQVSACFDACDKKA